MANREASLKVTLQPAAFQAGLRRLGNMTASAGKRMGAALKGPMVAGLKSAKSEVGNMLSTLKSGVGIAATLGGALSFVGMAKDAVGMQNAYRNIAFNVNKVAGNAESWESIQKMINDSVQRTGRSAEDLSEAFMTVFEATGDMTLAAKGMEIVGTTATATGHSIGALAGTIQLASRKFGIGADGMEDAMTRMIEKTGVGGKGIEELSSRFALMAGEAAGAGMKGAEGMSELLGMLLLLDSSIGEKADPGLKMMFQTVKSGSAGFIRLKKEMRGVKFDADMSAMDKILATLTSGRGRKMAEQVFTADARVVYDELAKPFDEAMEKSLAAGFSKKDAMDAAMSAFRKNLDDSAESTMQYSKIQDEANKRQADDPMVKMTKAMARMSDAFTKPEMIEAMNRLADKMPAFADAVVWALNTFLDNPWESIAVVVGGKIALAFAGSAVTGAIANGVKGLFARQAATTAVASALPAAATGGGLMASLGGLMATLGGGVAAASTAAVAGTVGAGLAVGGSAGYLGYKYGGGEAGQTGEAGAMRRAGSAVSIAGTTAGGGNAQQMADAILQLSAAKQELAANQSLLSTIVGDAAAMYAGVEAPTEARARGAREIESAERKLRQALDDLRTNAARAGAALAKVGDTSTTRGTMTPANPSPGADPMGG